MATIKNLIFLDASVIFAGIINYFGGSGEILRQGQKGKIQLMVNMEALAEVEEALKNQKQK